MTLIIDPLGSPEVHFMRDGVAVINLTGGATPTKVEIPALAGTVVVRAQSPSPGGPGASGQFILSTDFKPGDIVEVHAVSDFSFDIAAASGEGFIGLGTSVGGQRGTPRRIQKISATEWTS